MNLSTTRSIRQSPFKRLSTDHLWPLIILAGLSFIISLIPLPPNDFWWHLKIGEIIYKTHSIPNTNMFAWTLPSNTHFTYGAWLGELLLYLTYHLGGLEFVTFVRNFLDGIVFWLIGYEASRRSGSWRLAALAIVLAGGMTINNLPIRPQIWTWLPFMAFFILLGKFTDRQIKPGWLITLPILMVFWVNTHGSFILGIILIAIFFIGEIISELFLPKNSRSWDTAAWMMGTGVFTGLAMLINPLGIGVLNYVIKLMTDKSIQGLIVEWQSPSPNGIANIIFYASIILLVLTLAYSRYRPSSTETLLLCGFLWLAWTGQRYVVWYGMVVMPILMKAIRELPVSLPPLIPVRHWLNLAIAVIIFFPVGLVQPWFVESFPLPDRYWKFVQKHSPVGPLVDVDTPINAINHLKSYPGGKLFNEMGYGSYLIWAIPEQGVFIDPRVELFPYEQWEDYIQISHGARYDELLERYGVDRILLNVELQEGLAMVLPKDLKWKLEYEDQRAQIWCKIGTQTCH